MAEAPAGAEVSVAVNDGSYDPFKERKVSHPTTDLDTLVHLMKASLGTGILSMPLAFRYVGLSLGILGTIFVAVVATHCMYILVKTAHAQYYRHKISSLTYAELGELAFARGPPATRKFSKAIRATIVYGLFCTYFGTGCVYTVIIAKNFQQVIAQTTGEVLNVRLIILALLVPILLVAWVPNLKYLTPFSMTANSLMCISLGITSYYLFIGLPHVSTRNQATIDVATVPAFFSLVIFAIECIGTTMPFENNMKTPTHFLGLFGVMDIGMTIVSCIYIFLGFFGYWRFGDDTADMITLNLPAGDTLAQVVKILVGVAVFCTYPLQMYVCLEIALKWGKGWVEAARKPLVNEYIIRTVLSLAAVMVAIAVPTIGPFMGLIGALFFSITGLIVPALIELVTFWEVPNGLGKYRWILWKNVFVLLFGHFALIFGTYTSVRDIIQSYFK